MTTATFTLEPTQQALPVAAAPIDHPVRMTSRAFYREAARNLSVLVEALNRVAPPNVTNDPVWRDLVRLARTTSAGDVGRTSMILGLTCLFNPGAVIEALAESIGEVAA